MAGQTPDRESQKNELEREDSEQGTTAAVWFYTQRGETYGPVSSTDLWAAAHLGFLGPNDLVCRKDRETWVAARTIHGLFKEAG